MKYVVFLALCMLVIVAASLVVPSGAAQKDYLSGVESDKIRDAEGTNERIKLFVSFADDRLKKFQYELQHPSSNKHPEMLNALMNAYVGCVDDAADLVQLGIQKQENIRAGIDLMAGKTKEFLQILEKLSADGIEVDIYKDNLDDAIEGTRDAMNDAEKAKKAVAPPPMRRKN
jgi:heme exporter protein D